MKATRRQNKIPLRGNVRGREFGTTLSPAAVSPPKGAAGAYAEAL
jgi:hypothetical protein